MANGSCAEMTASDTPSSDARRLNERSKKSILNWLRNTYRGMIVATAGSISTPRTPIISASRPRNLRRENAYAAVMPRSTATTELPSAILVLLSARSMKPIGLLVGWAITFW